jgi:hypothetical protein
MFELDLSDHMKCPVILGGQRVSTVQQTDRIELLPPEKRTDVQIHRQTYR